MRAGYISIKDVAPLVSRLVEERWPDGDGLTVLSEKVGCDESTIRNIIDLRNEKDAAEFDVVDRIICALGCPMVWQGELQDVYSRVSFVETCALPSCNKKFPESVRSGKVKKFCSDNCRSLYHKTRAGVATGQRHVKRGRCFKGHKMTPENTFITTLQDGTVKRQCRMCRLESMRKYKKRRRREDPEWNARQNARRRELRAQKKEKAA